MDPQLTCVVDVYSTVHCVRRADLAAKKARMLTYYPSGKPIQDYPPDLRYKQTVLMRDQIDTVAVLSRKTTELDRRIFRKWLKPSKVRATACAF